MNPEFWNYPKFGISFLCPRSYLSPKVYERKAPKFKDKTLKELNISEQTGCTVIGVKDNIKGLIPSPSPETFIGVDDTLIVLGSDEQLAKMIGYYTR